MKKCRVASGRMRAPLRGALAAVLTLYLFNIYPKVCCGEGSVSSGNLSIDALFDFEVPVEVISQGVIDGYGELPDNFEDTMEGIFERNGWSAGWGELTESQWEGYDIPTNGMVLVGNTNVGGYNMRVPVGVFDQYGSNLLNRVLSTNASLSGTNLLPSLPSVGIDSLPRVWSYFSLDAPPDASVGLPSSPLVNGVFNSSFWVDHLSMSALQSFDGGALDSAVRNLPRDGVFAWVLPTYVGICDGVVLWVSEHSNGIRPYVRFVAVILYWVALYRFFIKRVVFVVEAVFSGTGESD